MSDQNLPFSCADHGSAFATFVCHHIAHGSGQGFIRSTVNPDDPCPDAWGLACDQYLLENGDEWNDVTEKFAHITLICNNCYEAAKKRNELST